MKKLQKAAEHIMKPMYRLSVDMFGESKKLFAQYRTDHNLGPAAPIDNKTVFTDIVKKVFDEHAGEIVGRSVRIGQGTVYEFGMGISLEAWVICRRDIINKKGMINNVPIIWKGVDDYFCRFLSKEKLEEITKFDQKIDKVENEDIKSTNPEIKE